MAYSKGNGSDSPARRRGPRRRKKVCAFCSDKEHDYIDYKDTGGRVYCTGPCIESQCDLEKAVDKALPADTEGAFYLYYGRNWNGKRKVRTEKEGYLRIYL